MRNCGLNKYILRFPRAFRTLGTQENGKWRCGGGENVAVSECSGVRVCGTVTINCFESKIDCLCTYFSTNKLL